MLDNRIETRSLVAKSETSNHFLHSKLQGRKAKQDSYIIFIVSIAKVMKIHVWYTKPIKVPDLDTPIITKSIVGVSIDMNKSRTQSGEALPRNKEIRNPHYEGLRNETGGSSTSSTGKQRNKDPALQGSLNEVDESTTSSTRGERGAA